MARPLDEEIIGFDEIVDPPFCVKDEFNIKKGLGPYEACCTEDKNCLTHFCLLTPNSGLNPRGRCNAKCITNFFGKVEACCDLEIDCLSGICNYGVCESNCPEIDHHIENREIGTCCDYDIQCGTGMLCDIATRTCDGIPETVEPEELEKPEELPKPDLEEPELEEPELEEPELEEPELPEEPEPPIPEDKPFPEEPI